MSETVKTRTSVGAASVEAPIAAEPAPVCAAHNISVTFRQQVLDGVSLSCQAGQWLGIIGPNGSGKTTLLRVLAGLLRPDEGAVEIAAQAMVNGEVAPAGQGRPAGQNIWKLSPRHRARQVAMIPQSPVTPPGVKVLDYALLGRVPYTGASFAANAEDVEIVRQLLEQLNIEQFADVLVGELSGGERQRVVIARALAQQTPLLLMDEPTSTLDLGQQLEVMELIDDLRVKHGLAVITAMHDLSLAGQFMDRLALLTDGVIVVEGQPQEILTQANIRRYYGANVNIVANGSAGVVLSVQRNPRRQLEKQV